MKNPWLKKNPAMSMWLSAAGKVAGKARGRMMAESRRQAAVMVNESVKQITSFWDLAALEKPAARRRKKRT